MRLFIFSLYLYANAYAGLIDRTTFQYAGEIGYVSVGLGTNITQNYSLDILYGYVPEDIGGHSVETLAFKNNYQFTQLEILKSIQSIYGGMNFYHVFGRKYQTHQQAAYPKNYYRISSLRLFPYIGYSSTHKNNTLYFEGGINDIWLINYINNSEVIELKEYVSLSLGWHYNLND